MPRGGREVLHDVSIEIAPGEVTALLGPNGAGKSTLVLTVAGALKPTSGTVKLGDEDLTKRRPEKIRQAGVAVVPEGRRLLPELTVADNLRVATYALTPDEARQGVDYALELFPELRDRWEAPGRSLSGGQQQMVVLAQALVSRPTVLLVDELSLGLAPVVVKRLVPTLGAVAQSGVGVLLIEQFAHVALGLANAAYILEGGRIRYNGTAQGAEGKPRAAPLGVPPAHLIVEDLAGKVAVVTGAASGIGRALAERFAAEGMRVVLADIERPVLEQAANELAETGADVVAIPTDVSLEDDVNALAAQTFERFGDVHLLCNNAGVGVARPADRGAAVARLRVGDQRQPVRRDLRAASVLAADARQRRRPHREHRLGVGPLPPSTHGAVQRDQGGDRRAERDLEVRARRGRKSRGGVGAVPELGAHEPLDR